MLSSIRTLLMANRITAPVLCYIYEKYMRLKWNLFQDYQCRLVDQAYYEYRSSLLFRERWQYVGLEYAESTFKDEVQLFYGMVKRGPRAIRARLFLDSLLGRPHCVYYT